MSRPLCWLSIINNRQIINNYVGQGNSSQEPFPNAADAFAIYNAKANYESSEPEQYYYDFRYGDSAFFVMDTRRYRSDIATEDPTTHTMLGDAQLAALYSWLGKVRYVPRAITLVLDLTCIRARR